MPELIQYHAAGKRKRAIARVYLRPGQGEIVINRKPLEKYFPMESERYVVRHPLRLTGTEKTYNVLVNVRGGGFHAQSEAVRHGIALSLQKVDGEDYRTVLKKAGLITRDARKVERKKYGQPGARKRFQYSKR